MTLVVLQIQGPGVYIWRLMRNGRSSRNYKLTAETREALKKRGRVLWATPAFGKGNCGEQKMFEIERR